jgi:hypothetical protein
VRVGFAGCRVGSRSAPGAQAGGWGRAVGRPVLSTWTILKSEQNGTAPVVCLDQGDFITALYRHLPVTESVVVPPEPRRSVMITVHRPPCPKCQTTTMLARIAPGPSGFDMRTFECPACEHVHQRAVELVDPMQSQETLSWFQGELRAPT